MARKAMNSRMAEVAKMLGVEFDEAFKIKEAPLAIYKIVENGLLQYDRERDCWNLAPRLLTEILAGYIEIVEPVWEPKEGEECYIMNSIVIRFFGKILIPIKGVTTGGLFLKLERKL